MNNLDSIPLFIILKDIINAEDNIDGSPFRWKVNQRPFLTICDQWEDLLSYRKGNGAISLVKYWLKENKCNYSKSDDELELISINILRDLQNKYLNINQNLAIDEIFQIKVLKNLAESFLNEYNLEFIEKNYSPQGFSNETDKIKYLSGLYKKNFTKYFEKFFTVEIENYFTQFSDSKEIIEVILEEGQSNEVPPMTSLVDFCNKYYPELTNEEISFITLNCKCQKITKPHDSEYFEYINIYKRKMNLTDLSKFLENIYSKKGMNDVLEYVDVEQLVAKFSQLIPTMNIHEYKSFILKEKLEEELISNNFKSSKPKL